MAAMNFVDGRLLLGSVHLHPRPPRRDVLAGTVRDLPDRGRGLAHHLGDLMVRRLEHLAQHEHCPLGRTEGHVALGSGRQRHLQAGVPARTGLISTARPSELPDGY
jgi:hypothetical protein